MEEIAFKHAAIFPEQLAADLVKPGAMKTTLSMSLFIGQELLRKALLNRK
jgi:hypothetical protein